MPRLDLGLAPYVLYGVKFVDRVPLAFVDTYIYIYMYIRRALRRPTGIAASRWTARKATWPEGARARYTLFAPSNPLVTMPPSYHTAHATWPRGTNAWARYATPPWDHLARPFHPVSLLFLGVFFRRFQITGVLFHINIVKYWECC